MTAAAVPFVFRAKSRKALLPFRSRISRAYCGGDPFSHPRQPSPHRGQILGGDYT